MVRRMSKSSIANATFVRFGARVSVHVKLEVLFIGKSLGASGATERLKVVWRVLGQNMLFHLYRPYVLTTKLTWNALFVALSVMPKLPLALTDLWAFVTFVLNASMVPVHVFLHVGF